jgi:aryl-alcohol dehydrogenase-like predicted oxidoreductase
MRQIELPNTGKRTSQLGFGCAYLTPDMRRLLDVARDAGIRHFDVGRSYNRGQAEAVVGRFLAGRGDEVTVTSKYGILPEVAPLPLRAARKVLGPLVRRMRRSGALARPNGAGPSAPMRRAAFTAEDARASLETSLRRLRRDRLDLFLMHEATPDELQDPDLLAFLEDAVARSVIGAFGVGGPSGCKAALIAQAPGFCRVLQFDWTLLDPPAPDAPFQARYRVFSRASARVCGALDDPATLRAWSDATNHDLARPGEAQGLLLKAALETQANDLILVSSTNPAHILANVETAEDDRLIAPALALAKHVRAQAADQGA